MSAVVICVYLCRSVANPFCLEIYWATHGGAELDLLLLRGGQRWGFEFKFADAPRTTKSLRVALDDLKLQRLFVIYPGQKDYTLDEPIEVLSLPGVEKLAGSLSRTASLPR